jgi:hypothetical protein
MSVIDVGFTGETKASSAPAMSGILHSLIERTLQGILIDGQLRRGL